MARRCRVDLGEVMVIAKHIGIAGSALIIACGSASANDSTAELKAGGLVFVHTDEISMAEERLYISPKEVRVDYRFRNNTDKDVEALVAFPMPDIVGGTQEPIAIEENAGPNFLGFDVTQDGKPVKTQPQLQAFVAGVDLTSILTAENIPLNPLSGQAGDALEKLSPEKIEQFKSLGLMRIEEWDFGKGAEKHFVPQWTLKTVYWWKTVYPAAKDVTVHHSYRTSVGGTVDVTYLDENGQPKGEQFNDYKKRYCLDDNMVKIAQKNWKNEHPVDKGPLYVENWISYILMTGNNWAGPIGSFTLTVDKGETQNIVSFCGEGVTKTGPTTFEMKKTDFYPERDLEILLLVPSKT